MSSPATPEVPAARPHLMAGAASVLISGLLAITWLPISLVLLTGGISGLAAAGAGALVLVPWVLAMRAIAVAERRRARAVHGIETTTPRRRVSTRTGIGGWLHGLWIDVTSWSFWRSVLHHHLTMFVALLPATLFWAGLYLAYSLAELAILRRGQEVQLLGRSLGPFALLVFAVLLLVLAVGALLAGAFAERGLGRVLLPTTEDALREEVTELGAQRQGAVDAAEQERLRIERDLHDGVQPRLVALAMTLGLARTRIESDPASASRLVGEAHEEAKAVITDLRQLARGIHPAVLTDRGLDAALSALAARSTVPVELTVDLGGEERRLSREVEAVAYFVVSEALTNIAKHAGATRARVDVRLAPATFAGGPTGVREAAEVLVVSIEDDGRGGAGIRRDGHSTGLAGLTDRVRATGGRLDVGSAPGRGTRLRAVVPVRAGTPATRTPVPTAPTGTETPRSTP